MMGREVPYDENTVCDYCGEKGATDFMGDCICDDCMEVQEVELEQLGLLPDPE